MCVSWVCLLRVLGKTRVQDKLLDPISNTTLQQHEPGVLAEITDPMEKAR